MYLNQVIDKSIGFEIVVEEAHRAINYARVEAESAENVSCDGNVTPTFDERIIVLSLSYILLCCTLYTRCEIYIYSVCVQQSLLIQIIMLQIFLILK